MWKRQNENICFINTGLVRINCKYFRTIKPELLAKSSRATVAINLTQKKLRNVPLRPNEKLNYTFAPETVELLFIISKIMTTYDAD
jgi:hypothetical protein